MLAISSSFILSLCLWLLFIAVLAAEPSPFSRSKGTEKEEQQHVAGSRVIASVEKYSWISGLKVACGTSVIKQ